ncbi:hypothetical protein FH972_026090 [Carpinus fangiana]|uniref:MAPEG family protein n=1 Tax=Carpinus fangiana TaxID=176857 RepID=A0A5N6L3Y0_9ROSI|nr:hypothetical protein FH972_026090 [Carpinus fangiana]
MASIISSSTNYSVYALPLYYLLGILPHGVAIIIASGGNPGKWDNRNPRAAGLKANLTKRLGPAKFARYERAESAHYNTLESFPLLATAVILANLAHLPTEQLNTFVAGNFILRSVYLVAYISTSSQLPTVLRTLIWYIQIGWILRITWQAAAFFA